MRSSHGPLKLFVGDIGDNRKSDLNRLFSKYGEISTIYIDENKHFAFVEFTSSSDAQRALEHIHNRTVNGSKLRVEYAKSDKPSRDSRRPSSRDHSPTSTLYSHLQVTANRLPPMQVFRQSYYQHYPYSMPLTNSSMASRGRSLTPPSLKQNSRLSSMHQLQSQDFYYHHQAMYSDPAYYRAYADPYLMQRLQPPPTYLPTTPRPSSSSSSSRSYRNMYSSSGINRYTSNTPAVTRHRRSRSRHRVSSSHRDRSSRERKHKRQTTSPSLSEQKRQRGPRTPPPKSSTHCSRKRSQSSSNAVSSASDQKSSSDSSSDDEEKESSSKKSLNDESDRKTSKRKTRE